MKKIIIVLVMSLLSLTSWAQDSLMYCPSFKYSDSSPKDKVYFYQGKVKYRIGKGVKLYVETFGEKDFGKFVSNENLGSLVVIKAGIRIRFDRDKIYNQTRNRIKKLSLYF